MGKKGMSEVFKYILVLAAGITLLIFFIKFGVGLRDVFKTSTSIEIRETLNDYFNALSSSSNLVTDQPLYIGTDVFINKPSCGNIQTVVEMKGAMPADYNHIIFSPSMLSKKMFVWAKEWNYPFKATNFFYLASPDTKIYFVGNSKLVNELYNGTIDKRFNIEKKDSINTAFINDKAKKYKKIIVIFFNNQAPLRTNLDNVRTRSIAAEDCSIEESTDEGDCRGYVNFGDKQYFFAGKAMLYGAIFAEDSDNYECGFNMAIERLKIVSEIYDKKKMILSRLKPNCGKYNFNVELQTSSLPAMHNSMISMKKLNNELGSIECERLFEN